MMTSKSYDTSRRFFGSIVGLMSSSNSPPPIKLYVGVTGLSNSGLLVKLEFGLRRLQTQQPV